MPNHSPDRPFATAADWAACRMALRGGSRTFHAASLVLPRRVRQSATGLYAFCRMADDAIDLGADRPAALQELKQRLTQIYRASPADHPCDRAFADVVFAHDIPRAFPEALIEGFEWDAANRRYSTLEELQEYAVRVAGVVGAMTAMLMGVREPRLIARACDLGVAMQLTNIARDVGEDARGGRLYLPLDWLREAHIDPESWSAKPTFNAGIATVVRRLLTEAETLYARSEIGLAGLPAACRPGMYAARLLYAEIGHELARRRLDSVNQRTVVSWKRKARLLANAITAASTCSASGSHGPGLPQADFLLGCLAPAAVNDSGARRGMSERVVWLVNLFERLERVEHARPAAFERVIDIAPKAS